MSKAFFQKENPASPFMVNGAAVPFESFGSKDNGAIALDTEKDKVLVDALNAVSGSRGVFKCSEAEYEELKKKPRESESLPSWHRGNDKLRLAPSAQQRPSPSVPTAVNPPPAPITPPEPPKGPQVSLRGFKPRTMRQSEIAPLVEKGAA